MPRYIDVKRLCDWLKNLKSGFTKEELVFRDELIEHLQGNNGIVDVLPTADVVEVVRCKDCKHATFYSCRNDACYRGIICEYQIGTDGDENFFCSYGERIEIND